MTRLGLLGWTVTLAALGGIAAHFTGGTVHRAIGWFTPMTIGVAVGFWLANRVAKS